MAALAGVAACAVGYTAVESYMTADDRAEATAKAERAERAAAAAERAAAAADQATPGDRERAAREYERAAVEWAAAREPERAASAAAAGRLAAERAEAATQRAVDERAAERARLNAAAAAELAAEYERTAEEVRQAREWWEGWEYAAERQRDVETAWRTARSHYNDAVGFWRAAELSNMTEDEARAEKKREVYSRCISAGHGDRICDQLDPSPTDRELAEEARRRAESSKGWSIVPAEQDVLEMLERIAAEEAERAAARERSLSAIP